MNERYWLCYGFAWVEVTKREFVAAERAAGFSGPDPGEPATHGFTGVRGERGIVTWGKESLEKGAC